MTIEARLSSDGALVLCGWRNALTGRYGCDGTIGWIVEDEYGRDIEYQPFYVQARPTAPDEVLSLEIDKRARARWDRKQRPLPGRRRQMADGRPVLAYRRWSLPVEAPCPGPQCGRTNRVTSETLLPTG